MYSKKKYSSSGVNMLWQYTHRVSLGEYPRSVCTVNVVNHSATPRVLHAYSSNIPLVHYYNILARGLFSIF